MYGVLTLACGSDMPLSSEELYPVVNGVRRLSLTSQGEDTGTEKSEVAMVSDLMVSCFSVNSVCGWNCTCV